MKYLTEFYNNSGSVEHLIEQIRHMTARGYSVFNIIRVENWYVVTYMEPKVGSTQFK